MGLLLGLILMFKCFQSSKSEEMPSSLPHSLEKLKQNHPQDQIDYVNDAEKRGWSVPAL